MSSGSMETPKPDPLDEFLARENDLVHDPNQVVKLMEIGRKSGFRDILHRKRIWPILLEVVNVEKLQESSDFLEWNKSKDEHSEDYDQLKKDAMRSFHSFKPFQNIEQRYLKKKQDELLELLDAMAKNQPKYKYFQGFHDIASIFISLFGMNTAYYMSHKLATTYLRDTFLYSFDKTIMVLDKLIWEIVVKDDTDFEGIFGEFEEHKLGFTMPWIITWFAHSFDDIGVISRIWDYLLSSKPSAIVYVSAALILNSKRKLLEYCNEMGGGYDVGYIHTFYQNIKDRQPNIESTLHKATQLEKRYPLEKLEPMKQLNAQTVIKEENFLKDFQFHEYADKFSRRKEARRKKVIYTMLGITVVVIGIAIWKKKDAFSWFGIGEL